MKSPYLKANKLIVPRQVSDLSTWPKETQLKPNEGAHWVGWIAVRNTTGPPTLYAAWQDYKRRGFYIQRRRETEHVTVRGTALEDLIAAVEQLHIKDHPMDITYTLTEAEIKQACRNYIVDRTKVEPDSITSVHIAASQPDRPTDTVSYSATVRVLNHTPEVG